MRILVVGAGATGGFFGGRLAEAGRDVTFLVRRPRAEQLRRDGLLLVTPHGDVRIEPAVVTGADLGPHYDLIFLSVKAYGLPNAIADLEPAVGPDTMILPVLNGLSHLDALDARFGADRVLGGLCTIAATLDPRGVIHQLSDLQQLTYGDRRQAGSRRIHAVDEVLSGAGFSTTLSDDVIQAMWQKWVFLGSLASITCLMRGPIGQVIAAPGGRELALGIIEEAAAVTEANGHPMAAEELDAIRRTLTTPGSPLAASMFRDLSQGYPVEADHVVGDLAARGNRKGVLTPLLAAAYTHLSVYEAGRASAP
jgi:2-dehydropantoate 2-reductase